MSNYSSERLYQFRRSQAVWGSPSRCTLVSLKHHHLNTHIPNAANLTDERWYLINYVSFEYGLLYRFCLLPIKLLVLNYPAITVGCVIVIRIGI